jgi:hypothetical protein
VRVAQKKTPPVGGAAVEPWMLSNSFVYTQRGRPGPIRAGW